MALELFPHNEAAYRAAVECLLQRQKAAVIQPTGTGKSFVAFKLAEENPEASVCWLGPSEYIFKTQLEGLVKAGGRCPDNIRFLTYTRLMLAEGILEGFEPDYIILDEFHRCGAQEWGKCVEILLKAHPGAGILGLSATSVRYLDNRRDMADELFDGAVAWEMTLGEAIARGILPAPVYVAALYSWQKELELLQKKVEERKNAGERKLNEELLEQLRRALEHSEGMDTIFARYMRPDGKYLVFCSDKEHMEEVLKHVPEWFGSVDDKAHVYKAYYDNPESDSEFAAFKADHDNHLKLLLCINMLNEGIHVEDVDGVVLLRPTVSPILYLQQIGRALSAGNSKEPVIFDLVNNFDSLYCVDSLQEEIQEGFALLQGTNQSLKITDRFKILDQVRECRSLFEQLRRNLSASWELYYQALQSYSQEHGNIRVPKKYVTREGLSLGTWLQTQRRVLAGKIPGRLTQEQITRLEMLGMVWEDGPAANWNRGYEALVRFWQENGNADVKSRYVTQDGYPLGKWVSAQRQKYQKMREAEGVMSGSLTQEQIQKLDKLGMLWSKGQDRWELYYQAAQAYYRKHGNLHVPWDYETGDGLALGVWLQKQRRLYDGITEEETGQGEALPAGHDTAGQKGLNKERIVRLEAVGMEWSNEHQRLWEEKYALACSYYEEHRNLNVPVNYCVQNIRLGRWLSAIRSKRKNPQASGPKLDEERIRQLNTIGMVWEEP